MMMISEVADHDVVTWIVGGLATALSGCACLIFSWLRNDIRNLASALTSLRCEFHDFKERQEEIHGVLKGKGILT